MVVVVVLLSLLDEVQTVARLPLHLLLRLRLLLLLLLL